MTSRVTVIGFILAVAHCTAYAIDTASFEFADGNETRMERIGAQWKWEQRWAQSRGTHISGNWELSLGHWEGRCYESQPGAIQNITDIGFAPVFRWEKDDLKGLYGEAGIGLHYLSGLYNNNHRRLSTHFQFGDRLGIGYVFRNKLDIGLRIQHFSNGGIKEPNSGVNFTVVRASYPLR